MFTGIVEGTATITKIDQDSGQLVLKPASKEPIEFALGDSISINGCCLSITSLDEQWSFFVSRETFDKTVFATLKKDDVVNFERAMKVGDRLGGHWVTGHIDGTASIHSIDTSSSDWLVRLAVDKSFGKYLVDKGSICVNGVSLTVNTVEDVGEQTLFSCTIIPVTQEFTNFSKLQHTDIVNIEVDILAKHLERLSKFC